jgi:hypothetical protein
VYDSTVLVIVVTECRDVSELLISNAKIMSMRISPPCIPDSDTLKIMTNRNGPLFWFKLHEHLDCL